MGTGWNGFMVVDEMQVIITDWDMGTGWNYCCEAPPSRRL